MKPASSQLDMFATKPKPAPTKPSFDPSNPYGLRCYQRDAKQAVEEALRDNHSALVVAATGTGKAQPLSAKVLTPSGWTTMGALVVGDEVIGSSGLPVKVTGVFPQGPLEVFRVRFSDDTETRACAEHLWAVRTKSHKNRGAGYTARSTSTLMGDLADGSGAAKWFVPVVQPVHLKKTSDLPINPWLLGVLIGDGCLRKSSVTFSSIDPHIIRRVEAESGLPTKRVSPNNPQNCDYLIVQGRCGRNGGPLTNALRALGAWGKYSHEKRIPPAYLSAPLADRVELLRGLMDTDGHASRGGGAEFYTSSPGLACDFLELVRSLGGTSTARLKPTTHRPCYRVWVDVAMNPFSLPRKAARYREDKRAARVRAIASIEPDGIEPCQCISVDAGDRLYVTDDFVLTHNTRLFASIAGDWKGRVLVLAHRDELISQTIEALELLTAERIGREQAEDYANSERIVVGSVQTCHRDKRLERLVAQGGYGLVIIDECFPAGTLVDGRPIETIDPGDTVLSVDHASGQIVRRQVTRVFEKPAPRDTFVLSCGATSVRATGNHPVFVRGKGYVNASEIRIGDVLCVWSTDAGHPAHVLQGMQVQDGVAEGVCDPAKPSAEAADHEAEDLSTVRGDVRASDKATKAAVLRGVCPGDLRGEFVANEQAVRVRAYDKEQPDAPRGQPEAHEGYLGGHRSRAEGAWREWPRRNESGGGSPSGAGTALEAGLRSPDENGAAQRIPVLLQAGSGGSRADDLDRGGRPEPLRAGAPASGPKEVGLLVWARVDHVARHEQADPGGERVYNLEVEGSHTYFANGVLVHNCHHAPAKSYRKVIAAFDGCKVLGVTATPDRGDEQALGKIFEVVAYTYGIEDAIPDGWLVPIEGRRLHLDSVDVSDVQVSQGDLAVGQLDEVMLRAVEGIAQTTIGEFPHQRGVVFVPGKKSALYGCERFNAIKPGCAVTIVEDTPKHERQAIMRAIKRGEVQWFVNCMIATEGFDWPQAEVMIGARPTKSRALFTQMVGRVTRPLAGTVDPYDGEALAEQRRAAIAASAKPRCIVADLVGNSGKHSLASIEDVLGGNYDEEVVEKAKKIAEDEEGGDPVDHLKKAQAEINRQREQAVMAAKARQLKGSAQYRVERYDPFSLAGIKGGLKKDQYLSKRYGGPMMTDGQRSFLETLGYKTKDMGAISMRGASKIIEATKNRRSQGLCTIKQLNVLAKYGVSGDTTFEGARAAMDYVAGLDWGKRGTVDSATVRHLAASPQKASVGPKKESA